MQLFPLRIVSDNSNFNFVSIKRYIYMLSCLMLFCSVIFMLIWRLNFGIDFTGGINIEAYSAKKINIGEIRENLTNLDKGEFMLQYFGDEHNIAIKFGNKNADGQLLISEIKESLKNTGYDFVYKQVDFVGPQVGDHLIKSGAIAIGLAFLAIMFYVAFRFEWQFGICVLMALSHNIIISLGFMSISGLDFNLSTIAALLTIIGYSVNDSVVIFDRIRENLRKKNNTEVDYIINISVNETLSRTTLTSITTLLANGALVIFGGEAIRSFSILVFVGIFVGTYASIFLSAQLLPLFKFKRFKS